MNDDNRIDDEEPQQPEAAKGVFEMFEPPPEIDPNRFGPIPMVPDPEEEADPVATGAEQTDESISAIFGFDPIVDGEEAGGDRTTMASDTGPDVAPAEEVGPASEAGPTDLPHWTEPATGVVPKVIARDGEESRSDVTGPRWHGEGPQWAGDDLEAVFADEQGVGGRRVSIDDEADDRPEIPSAAGAPQRSARPAAAASPARPAHRPEVDNGERDLVQAVMFGFVLAAVAALAFWLGNIPTIILIAVAAALAVAELYESMRKAGLHPATLLGITAAVALPLATYNRGEGGFTLVIGMSVIFGALWYLVGADNHRPALNLGLTMLGITWIGGMAGFAALLIRADQVSILLAAVIITVASDTGAYAGGRAMGTRPFHPASPNKTWEGAIIGFVAAVVTGFIVGLLGISPFSDNLVHALLLGAVVGIFAPMGDITESLVKRDLGVKDMGHLIPGHGGVLDRLDGVLFVLPAAYYLARVLDLI